MSNFGFSTFYHVWAIAARLEFGQMIKETWYNYIKSRVLLLNVLFLLSLDADNEWRTF